MNCKRCLVSRFPVHWATIVPAFAMSHMCSFLHHDHGACKSHGRCGEREETLGHKAFTIRISAKQRATLRIFPLTTFLLSSFCRADSLTSPPDASDNNDRRQRKPENNDHRNFHCYDAADSLLHGARFRAAGWPRGLAGHAVVNGQQGLTGVSWSRLHICMQTDCTDLRTHAKLEGDTTLQRG